MIDHCTDFFLEVLSSVRSHTVTFSKYEHRSIAKGLTGMAPSRALASVSDLFAGRSSDKYITMMLCIYLFD